MKNREPRLDSTKNTNPSVKSLYGVLISVLRKCSGYLFDNKIAIGIFVGCFLLYNAYTYIRMSGDTTPAIYLPYSIIYHHDLFLERFFYPGFVPDAYAFTTVNGHLMSIFPIVVPVLITPFVFVCTLGLTPDFALVFANLIARTTSAGIAALAVCIFYLIAIRLVQKKIAILSTLIFAFATSTWSISSQALWQHGMIEVLLLLMIYVIIRNEEKSSLRSFIYLGILSGLFVFCRPPDAILLIPILCYVLFRDMKARVCYFVPAIISGLPFLAYNWYFFGNVFGGYVQNLQWFDISLNVLPNYLGLFISPNKGLFIFSPILILAVFGYFYLDSLKDANISRFFRWFGPVLILDTVIYGFFSDWGGGYSYGPRFLTALAPVLCIYVAIFLLRSAAHFRAGMYGYLKAGAIALLIIVSVAIQFIGVFYFPYLEDSHNPEPWDISNPVILVSYEEGSRWMDTFILQSIPPHPPLFYYSGYNNRLIQNARYARSIGDFPNASMYYHEYLRADPNSYVIWNNLGSCLAVSGDYRDALQSFNIALAINPQFKEAEMNRDFINEKIRMQNVSITANTTYAP